MEFTINQNTRAFEPVEITIKIESFNELACLAKLFNIDRYTIDSYNKSYLSTHDFDIDKTELWNQLNKLVNLYS